MSRADMAQVLSSCLEGVKTRGAISVNTPRFRVVEEGEESIPSILAKDMDAAGFRYPLIAKPLTAAGTKSSHHMYRPCTRWSNVAQNSVPLTRILQPRWDFIQSIRVRRIRVGLRERKFAKSPSW